MAFTKRSKVNLINLIVTISIVLVAIKVSDGSFAKSFKKITNSIDKSLAKILTDDDQIDFSDITVNGTYFSNVTYDPKGMNGLHELTNQFLKLILSKNAIDPYDFIRVNNGQLQAAPYADNWQALLKTYAGILTIVIILLLFVILIPFCGFCFCCCRCCGKCGGRSMPYDKKHDFCKKFINATLLIIFGTLLLFCVVCAFASNEQLNDGMNHLPTNLQNGTNDVNTFIDTTSKEIENLLGNNLNEFKNKLNNTLSRCGEMLFERVKDITHAISVSDMSYILKTTNKIFENLSKLKGWSTDLRNYASQLNDALRQVKVQVLGALDECTLEECSKINADIAKLDTNIHFNKIPDLREIIELLDTINKSGLNEQLTEANQKLLDINNEIEKAVNSSLAEASKIIDQASNQIVAQTTDVKSQIIDLQNKFTSTADNGINTANNFIDEYFKYWHYGGLAISCLLLLITVLIILGLICGICGKRPDYYGSDCCNKNSGSNFLICGVMVMFLTGFVIAIIVLVMFMVGTVSQRLVCDPLEHPNNSLIFELLNDLNLSESANFKVDIGNSLYRCSNGETIHEVLQLENISKINEVKDYLKSGQFNIDEILKEINLNNIDFNIELLGNELKIKLNEWADNRELNEDLSDKLQKLSDELNNTEFASSDLNGLADEINKIIPSLPDLGVTATLKITVIQLQAYQVKIVVPMLEIVRNANVAINELNEDIKFKKGSFKAAIESLMDEVEEAENLFADQDALMKEIKDATESVTNGIIPIVQQFLDRVYDCVTKQIGRCEPINNVVQSLKTSACDNIVLRFNGFWFSLFWALILYIPILIISVNLAGLYQKYNPYAGGPLAEADYLYDAYAERDNIPLNSRNNKVKKKKNKRREERQIGQGDMARDYPGGSHQDDRYSDMAQKQWEDFPAGGPPQYERAPTEYERPPPYYYPGSGDNQ